MNLPKFVNLIFELDDSDIQSLRVFLSQRLEKSSQLFKIFNHIYLHRDRISKIDSIEKLIESTLPNSNSKIMGNYLSSLFALSEEWMIQDQLKSEKFTSEYLLLKWQKKKGITRLADQTAKSLEKKLVEHRLYDLEIMQASLHLLNYYLIQNDNKVKDHPDKNLKQLIHSYNVAVKSQYLIIKTELENLMGIHQGDFSDEVLLIDKVTEQLPQSELSILILKLHDLVINDNLDALYFLKNVLIEKRIEVDSQLHFIITSYCYQRVMRLWTKGKHDDLELINFIFNYALEHNVFTKNGKIPSASFHSFVTQLAFYTKDYDQTEQFILTWINKVDTNKKEATLALARAQNCLYTERYEEIFQYTWRSDFDTFNQKNLAQGIHLIATFMFKEKEKEVFENTLNLSLLFLKRNKFKMSNHIYESYKNLCLFMQKVHQKKKIIVSLADYKPIIYKSWCEKILKDGA